MKRIDLLQIVTQSALDRILHIHLSGRPVRWTHCGRSSENGNVSRLGKVDFGKDPRSGSGAGQLTQRRVRHSENLDGSNRMRPSASDSCLVRDCEESRLMLLAR